MPEGTENVGTENQSASPETQSGERKPGTAPGSDLNPESGQQSQQDAGDQQQSDTRQTGGELQLNVPQGMDVDPEVMNSFKSFVQESGLSQEQAQRIVDMQVQMHQKQQGKFNAQQAKLSDKWYDDLSREYGGEQPLQEKAAKVNSVIAKFDTNGELAQLLKESGQGNNPAIFRFMTKVADAMSEDTLVRGERPTGPQKSVADKMGYKPVKLY